jgi:hypothetical protein
MRTSGCDYRARKLLQPLHLVAAAGLFATFWSRTLVIEADGFSIGLAQVLRSLGSRQRQCNSRSLFRWSSTTNGPDNVRVQTGNVRLECSMRKKKLPQKLIPWLEAKKRHHLSDMHIQMARELGMNPKKLGKLDNHKQEPWKLPLPQFIEKCYLKSFKRPRPEKIAALGKMSSVPASKTAKAATVVRSEDKSPSTPPTQATMGLREGKAAPRPETEEERTAEGGEYEAGPLDGWY